MRSGEVSSDAGGEAISHRANVTKADEVADMVEQAKAKWEEKTSLSRSPKSVIRFLSNVVLRCERPD